MLSINGRRMYAHRLAWELAHGPIPHGLHVCHHCDRPSCCKVKHLFLGTDFDNLSDMRSKGRAVNAQPKGQAHGMAKLTDTLVREIRERQATSGITQRQLAKEYGVNQAMIWRIVKRTAWSHIA